MTCSCGQGHQNPLCIVHPHIEDRLPPNWLQSAHDGKPATYADIKALHVKLDKIIELLGGE